MKFIVLAALILVGFNVTAEETAAPAIGTSIAKGDWQIAGTAAWSAIGSGDSTIYASPRAEYFICDHVSLGASLGLYFYKSYANDSFGLQYTTVGPSATMYFSRSTIAPYVNQQALLALPKYGKGMVGGITGFGVAFFANEHISISPELDATYAENSKGDLSLNIRIATYL